jgi:hypothetical protein
MAQLVDGQIKYPNNLIDLNSLHRFECILMDRSWMMRFVKALVNGKREKRIQPK